MIERQEQIARGDHHGLYASEREIMDLHDAGHSIAEIAAQVGRSDKRVRIIVEMYRVGGADSWASAVRAGSAALLAAIERHHPETMRAA